MSFVTGNMQVLGAIQETKTNMFRTRWRRDALISSKRRLPIRDDTISDNPVILIAFMLPRALAVAVSLVSIASSHGICAFPAALARGTAAKRQTG